MQIEAYLEKNSSHELPDGFREWLKYEYTDDIDAETEIEVLLDEFDEKFITEVSDNELEDFYVDNFCSMYGLDGNVRKYLNTEKIVNDMREHYYTEIPGDESPRTLYLFNFN